MHLSRTIFTASLLSLLSVSTTAAAQQNPYDDDDPEALFKEGVAKMAGPDLDGACRLIARSYEIDPRLGTLYGLAECEAKRDHLATALLRYDEFISRVNALSRKSQAKYQDRKDEAERQRTEIATKTPHVVLTLPLEAPWTTAIKLNGVVVELSTLYTPRPVDPGAYVATTRVPNGNVARVEFTIAKGEKKEIMLPVQMKAEQPKPCAQLPPATRAGCAFTVGGADHAPGASLAAGFALLVWARRRRSRSTSASAAGSPRRW